MEVQLREFDEKDFSKIEEWASSIDSHEYMSRYLPKGSTVKQPVTSAVLYWFVIMLDGDDIGTVWLEKDDAPETARLGIILGNISLFDQGIGKKAINMCIERLKSLKVISKICLNVRDSNIRAISCYKKCGFKTVSYGSKTNGSGEDYSYSTMELKI